MCGTKLHATLNKMSEIQEEEEWQTQDMQSLHFQSEDM